MLCIHVSPLIHRSGTHLLQLLAPTDAMIILNNTRTSFAILPNGTLVTAVVLDREQQADYTLTIVSQEEGLLVPLGVVVGYCE